MLQISGYCDPLILRLLVHYAFRALVVTIVLTLLLLFAALSGVEGGVAQNAQTASPSQVGGNEKCVIAGRVTNVATGEPLKKASVRLETIHSASARVNAATNGPTIFRAASDAEGHFRFENVDPGEHRLSGEHGGFITTPYGAKGPLQLGTNIRVTRGQEKTGLELQLIPQAVISGKVVDEDGDPVSNFMIYLMAQIWSHGKLRYLTRGGVPTDATGQYRLSNLSSGNYYVCAQPAGAGMRNSESGTAADKPDIRVVRTFYPSTLNIEDAIPSNVQPGQDADGSDIRIRTVQTYHVRGKIVGSIGDRSETLILNLNPKDLDVLTFASRSNLDENNTFDLAGVSPGSYSLNLLAIGGAGHVLAHQSIHVGSNDVNNVILNVVSTGALDGQVRLKTASATDAAPTELANMRVWLTAVEGSNFGAIPVAAVNKNGSFLLRNVIPNRYYVNISGGPEGAFLSSVTLNDRDVLGSEIDLSQAVSGRLDVTFQTGAAEVDGTAILKKEASVNSSPSQPPSYPSTVVVLMPEAIHADGTGIRVVNTDQQGAFGIRQLPPGNYRAYAFEQLDTTQLQNPDFLTQFDAIEVEAKENDKRQLDLSPIAADDIMRIAQRAGIQLR